MNKLTKKCRWVIIPCPDYDVPAMESWLEEQAARGWFLSKENGFFLGLACLESGAPKRVRYRLDAIPKEKLFSEFPENKQSAIELTQEMGWEYVTERKEFLIYRCDNAGLPELNTDPAVQALSLKRVQRALADRIFSTCYYLFLYPVLLFALRMPAFLLSVLTLGTLRFLGILSITIVQSVEAIRDWRRLKKLRKHLQSGGHIEHTNGWRDEKKRSIARKIISPILTAIWLVLLCSFVVASKQAVQGTPADLGASPVPAASSFLTLPLAETDDHDELALLARSDLLARGSIYKLEERAGRFRYDAEYYEMRAPWLAKWLASDFRRYDARGFFGRHAYEITELALPALDADTVFCYFLRDTSRGHYWGHRVIVQKGCKLVCADIWWPYESAFPAEAIAQSLVSSIT